MSIQYRVRRCDSKARGNASIAFPFFFLNWKSIVHSSTTRLIHNDYALRIVYIYGGQYMGSVRGVHR